LFTLENRCSLNHIVARQELCDLFYSETGTGEAEEDQPGLTMQTRRVHYVAQAQREEVLI
jgi:hypothetical protein